MPSTAGVFRGRFFYKVELREEVADRDQTAAQPVTPEARVTVRPSSSLHDCPRDSRPIKVADYLVYAMDRGMLEDWDQAIGRRRTWTSLSTVRWLVSSSVNPVIDAIRSRRTVKKMYAERASPRAQTWRR